MTITPVLRLAMVAFACSSFLSVGCAASLNQWMTEKFPVLARHQKSANARKHLKHPGSTLLAAARFHEHVGNLAGARESYDLMLAENTKSTDAILGLARLDQLANRNEQAEEGYLKALKQKPNDPHVLDATGQFYASQEQWDDAQKLLNRAMLTAPDDKQIRYHLAVVIAKSGNSQGAMPHFVRAVGDANAHYNIALLLHEQGKLDESEQHLLQAVIKKPEHQQAQYWLDEIRRERQAELLLANQQQQQDLHRDNLSSPIEYSLEQFAVSPDEAAVPPNLQAGHVRAADALSHQELVPISHQAGMAVSPEQFEQRKNQRRDN